jgi:predicted transcriptional regulator
MGSQNNERVRLSVDVSPELDAMLEQLAKDVHGTKSDVLRKGIALLQVAVDAKKQGQKFGVADPNTKQLEREIIGI